MNIQFHDFLNESDVEQKFITPLLTLTYPTGLGFNFSDFRTKSDLRQIEIGKGKSAKLYYPDYMIILQGVPAMVIEAKSPDVENLEAAISEARLYANEINAFYRKDVNPCKKILVTNGRKLIACYSDTNEPEFEIPIDELFIANPKFHDLLTFAAKKVIYKDADAIHKRTRGSVYYSKPSNILGGRATREESVPENSFGTNMSLDLGYLFNPQDENEKSEIVKNAYVTSKKRAKHVIPIDKIIKSAKAPSLLLANAIEDTSKPKEILQKIAGAKNMSNRLLILVGSVGSGKSTFTDYLRIVALDEDVKNSTTWISVNLNNAPVSNELIYPWLCQNVIEGLKKIYNQLDFADLATIRKLYHEEILEFEKGPALLLNVGSDTYNLELFRFLTSLQSDKPKTLLCFLRFLCLSRGKYPIIILDNCDKRNRDEQLLMFQVANWLKNTFPCLVFLPMRDVTFDLHKKEPPLDTVIKDMVFRIDPPTLESVLYQRFKFATRQIKGDNNLLSYRLPNGIKVEYKREEQLVYLDSILKSLFQNHQFKKNCIWNCWERH